MRAAHHLIQQYLGEPESRVCPGSDRQTRGAKIKIMAASVNPSDVENVEGC